MSKDIALVRLDRVNRQSHRIRIKSWLETDQVSRWWGDAETNLHKFDETPADKHAMIVNNDQPVGYIRWEIVDTAALLTVGLDAIPARSIDVDLFIGDPDMTGQGIGPKAVRLLVDHLRDTTDAPLVGFCTSVDNAPAQSSFRKAGCTLMTTFDDPTFGPCQVYVRWLR